MSKQVDERVVSMQFDNKHFESNVQTTMSTLDKLKAKLNLTGAAKGLESIDAASKKVDMSGLGKGVEAVSTRFSALEVMAVTALANITNSAVNAGKRIATALTIQPIKTGFQEYETQMNAVQTILANTQSKGSTLDDVNKALDTLNTYADKTIYNFTEMTRNIGTFTAAGVDLQTSVDSIKGIANLAAVSGSSSQQASTAMYQLSQALAAGRVSLMDWNSVVNAGMGGELFQNALLRTSELLKTGGKEAVKTYGSFRESLTKGQWLTTEVLTETLKQLSGAYTEADLIAQGFTEEQAKEISQLAQTATDAATKVKTFSQLWDVMKESAQSGWAQTWKLIVGDFEQAKSLLTPLADFFTKIIGNISDARNKLIKSALGRGFSKTIEGVNKAFKNTAKSVNTITKPIKTVTTTLESLESIVNKVIEGSFGNGKKRFDALTEAGYNYCKVQNKVNEKLGDSFRYSKQEIDAQDKLLSAKNKTTDAVKSQSKETDKLTDADKKNIIQLAALSDAQLKSAGCTEEQIKAIHELREQADKLGMSVPEFINKIDELDGRTLLINSFKNAGQGLVSVFKAMKDAWVEIFPPMSADTLFNIIAGLHKFSTHLVVGDETVGKLKSTLKGLFAILDIVLTIIAGPLKIAFKIFQQLLGAFDLSILDVTAKVGDAIVRFRDWLDSVLDFTGAFKWVSPYIKKATDAVKEWIEQSKPLEKIGNFFRAIGSFVRELFSNLSSAAGNFDWGQLGQIFYNITKIFPSLKFLTPLSGLAGLFEASGSDAMNGLFNGLSNGVSGIMGVISSIASSLINTFKNILGIASPSKVFFAIGGFIIAGLLGGIMGNTTNVFTALKTFGTKMIEFFSGLDITVGKIIAAGGAIAALLFIKKVLDIANNFSMASKGIGKLTGNLADLVKTFNDGLVGKFKPSKWTLISEAILKVAIAVGILVAAVILMSKVEMGTLWASIGALATIGVILGGLVVGLMAATKLLGNEKQVAQIGRTLLQMAIAMGIIALVAKKAGSMTPAELTQGTLAMTAFAGIITGLMAATKLIKGGAQFDTLGKSIFKIALAIGVMMLVAKKAGSMDRGQLLQGTLAIAAFGGIIVGLMAATKLIAGNKNVGAIGSTIFKIAGAIAIMVMVAKIAGKMRPEELLQGTLAIAAFSGIIVGLMAATKLLTRSTNVDKIGGTILKIAGAIAIMVIVAKIAGKMSQEELRQGTLAVTAFSGLIVGLMAATKLILGSTNVDKIGGTILKIAGAIAIMVIVAKIAAKMSVADIAKGILVISAFGGIIVGLMAATKLIKGGKNIDAIGGSILKIAGAIAIMVLAVALLSLIKPEPLFSATLALTIIIGMFSLLVYAAKDVNGSVATILVLTVAVVALAGMIFWIGKLPVENALAASVSLSILLLALCAALYIVGQFDAKLGDVATGVAGLLLICVPLLALVGILALMQNIQVSLTNVLALAGLATVCTLLLYLLIPIGALWIEAHLGAVALTAMAVPLLAFVGVLARMQNVQVAATNVLALAGLATVCTVLLLLLVPIGALWIPALIGVTCLTAMAVPLLAFVGVLALMQNVQNATVNANLLMHLMTVMAAVLIAIAPLAPLAVLGVAAMTALATLMGVIGVFAVGVGALMEKFPALQSFLDTGLDVLIQLAGGIGQMIGAFVGGIITEVANTLPQLGICLSQFMAGATPFIVGIKMVDDSVLKGVGILAAAVIALTAADLIAGVTALLSGGSSFSSLGTELSMFITNAMPFIVGARLIDPTVMEGVKTLAEAILILTGANLLESITKFIGGESSLATFGSQLGGLGTNLNTFVTNLGTFSEDQVTTIDCAGRAIKALAEAANAIPNEGGWAAKLFGDNSLAAFGSQLPGLATNLNGFITNLGSFGDDSISTVECAGKAITTLANAASEIPNEGGLWAKIAGDNSIATFGSHLPGLGTHLKGFITNLGTFDESAISTVNCAGNAIKTLAAAAKSIPKEGGLWQKIVGENSLATFGDKLPGLATDIASFVKNLGTFGEGQISTVKSACSAINAIAKLGKVDLDDTASGLKKVGGKLTGFAENLASFVSALTNVGADNISSAITKAKDIVSFAKTAAGTNIESLKTFGNSLKKVGTEGVKGFVDAFTGESPKSKVKKAGEALANTLVKGAESKKSSAKKSFEKIASSAISGLASKTNKSTCETAGKDLGQGLINGINAKKQAAYDAGFALGKKAAQGVKDGEDSNSPSKLTIKYGKWLGEGLIIGINAMGKAVYNTGHGLGRTATNAVSTAISHISDIVSSDIDSQPTIRPVVDLTDVKAGAGAIGSMFNNGYNLAVDTRTVGTIATSMSRFQNRNDSHEIVSAIDGLRGDIHNMPRNSYNINGITYDDESVVAEAIQTIVRHAKIGRRT